MSGRNGPVEITGGRGQQISRKFLGYVASDFASLPASLFPLMGLWGREGVCFQWALRLGELYPWSTFREPKREIQPCVLVLKILPMSHLPIFVTAS